MFTCSFFFFFWCTSYSSTVKKGGLKFETLEKILDKKGYEEVYKKAVYGMLPANRLRDPRMKNLVVND